MLAALRRPHFKQLLLRLLCLSLLGAQLFGGAQFVESAVERAQFYAGTCLAIDPNCTQVGQHVSLGEAPSHMINLAIHLMGLLPQHGVAEPPASGAPQVATAATLPRWLFVTSIEHPPKA